PINQFGTGLGRRRLRMAPLRESPPPAENAEMSLNWDDLRFVLALHRAGSLGAAARLLKVEQSTVSRRLSSLEAAVGTALVARTPEGVVLSDAGSLVASMAAGFDAGVEA